jgi:hypothetical protein
MNMAARSRTRPDGEELAWIVVITAAGVASGALGFWCARRTEAHRDEVTCRRSAAVWVASAPEAVVLVPLALLTAFALPFESGFRYAGVRGLAADAAYVTVFYGPCLTPLAAQAVATRR